MSYRKDFAAVKEEIAVSSHNSNMTNLAHADRNLEEYLAELEEKKAKALALRSKVEELAAKETPSSKDIWEVYDEIRNLK